MVQVRIKADSQHLSDALLPNGQVLQPLQPAEVEPVAEDRQDLAHKSHTAEDTSMDIGLKQTPEEVHDKQPSEQAALHIQSEEQVTEDIKQGSPEAKQGEELQEGSRHLPKQCVPSASAELCTKDTEGPAPADQAAGRESLGAGGMCKGVQDLDTEPSHARQNGYRQDTHLGPGLQVWWESLCFFICASVE